MHHLPSRIYLGSLAQADRALFRRQVPDVPAPAVLPSRIATFSYVHEGTSTLHDFTHHLEAYLPLFRQLSEFGFLTSRVPMLAFTSASELFDSLVKIPLEDQIADQLLRLLPRAARVGRTAIRRVTDADLLFRNAARSRFHGERFEASIGDGREGMCDGRSIRREFGGQPKTRIVTFETCFLTRTRIEESEAQELG